MVDEWDTRLWRIIKYYVSKARELEDFSKVNALGMDETSIKGHNYISVFVDLIEKNVLFATEGKDHTTVDKLVEDFKEHKGDPDNVKIITCDMSLGFEKGIRENFKNSNTIIDKFHVIKHANEHVDKIRKAERKENCILNKTKYIWLKNDKNLTEKQRDLKKEILKSYKHLKTGRAYSMKVEMQDIYEECYTREDAEERLKKLISWMMHSRLDEMKKFAKMLKDHWNEVLNYFDYRFTNAILEGINSIIQNVKRRARGFKNTSYFITMIYLCCSDLDFEKVFEMMLPA